jgi:hypothetical protein
MGFYERDVKDMIYAKIVSPNLSHWVIRVFHNILRIKTFIFSTGFLKDYIGVHSSYFFTGFLDEFDIKDM